MAKYRRIPREYDAELWHPHDMEQADRLDLHPWAVEDGMYRWGIKTPNGLEFLRPGDWIVTGPDGPDGPRHVVRADTFIADYEPVVERKGD